LGAGGVGGHADRGFDPFTRWQFGVGPGLQVALELGEKARQQVDQRIAATRQLHVGLRPGVAEQTLERPQHRPARVVTDGGGVQPEAQVSGIVGSDERRPGVDTVERHDGIVPPVDDRRDRVGCAEVDPDPHRGKCRCCRAFRDRYSLSLSAALVRARAQRHHSLLLSALLAVLPCAV
jgi:hypothetical protein